MEYKKFMELIQGGEKDNVDYKLDCQAFNSGNNIAPNAELAKDICAMANNGNVTSYIIVGVGDDRTTFKAVRNSKLTDENVQDLCRTTLWPPVKIQAEWVSWTEAGPE